MSEVIKLSYKGNIAIIALEDRESGNTFSKKFVEGINEVFLELKNNPDVKVIVLHGYDNYFCCGGTKQELIDIFEGRIQFNDLDFYNIFLRTEVPVISAMQGHALGGGLAFGCYADIIVMAEECLYSANFMKYGFTPGMGITYILPEKLGTLLGNEMLMTAKNYNGRELKERGAPIKIVKKNDVINTAMELAKELADKPLVSLKVLKKHLTKKIVMDLPVIIEEELKMHNITFALPEVRKRIESLFGV